MTPSRYTFMDYSPAWPTEFAQEAARLTELLGEMLITVHHVGSTSVPGLAAKPTIDMLPLVRPEASPAAYTPLLQAAGYKAWGEYGLPGRQYFTKDRDGYRTHNIHIYPSGHPEAIRHLAFCAYLRSHPQTRDEYAALKREAYTRHPADIGAYNDFKDDWIKRLEPIALAWYRQQAP